MIRKFCLLFGHLIIRRHLLRVENVDGYKDDLFEGGKLGQLPNAKHARKNVLLISEILKYTLVSSNKCFISGKCVCAMRCLLFGARGSERTWFFADPDVFLGVSHLSAPSVEASQWPLPGQVTEDASVWP